MGCEPLDEVGIIVVVVWLGKGWGRGLVNQGGKRVEIVRLSSATGIGCQREVFALTGFEGVFDGLEFGRGASVADDWLCCGRQALVDNGSSWCGIMGVAIGFFGEGPNPLISLCWSTLTWKCFVDFDHPVVEGPHLVPDLKKGIEV